MLVLTKMGGKNKVFEAFQWFKLGDHAKVIQCRELNIGLLETHCLICGCARTEHGALDMAHVVLLTVCPADWILMDAQGTCYVRKPTVFAATCEEICLERVTVFMCLCARSRKVFRWFKYAKRNSERMQLEDQGLTAHIGTQIEDDK